MQSLIRAQSQEHNKADSRVSRTCGTKDPEQSLGAEIAVRNLSSSLQLSVSYTHRGHKQFLLFCILPDLLLSLLLAFVMTTYMASYSLSNNGGGLFLSSSSSSLVVVLRHD